MGTSEHHETPNNSGREPITPAKRARLDRLFEAARQKAGGLNPNYDYASELYVQCVLGDPGNDVYVKAYIESLQKKYNNNRSGAPLAQFKERSARNAITKAVAEQNWDEVIKNSVKVFAINPWDVSALTAMAAAAKKLGYFECEMYYLKTALVVNPKDAAVNKLCAAAAAERGLLDQAIYCWHKVEEAHPDDNEAKRAISMLQSERMRKGGFSVETVPASADTKHILKTNTVAEYQEIKPSIETKLLGEIAKDPKKLSPYFELSQFYFHENRFDKAEDILERAFEASNGDADVREKWEEAQLRSFRHKILSTADAARKKELQEEYNQKELDFFRKRCERFPGNLFFRYDLGVRYMITKQYNEAIREFQLSRNDPRRKGVSILALGKCFQQIRQYRLALSHYESAIEEISQRDVENMKDALYLAGKLALTLKLVDGAEKHLSRLAAADFSYKDVSALLDKIAELRKNQLPQDEKSNFDE